MAFDEFIERLKEFHEQRGTILETTPRVNGKNIDLQKLFNSVISQGGYDQVSREKLAWRRVGQEFHLGSTNAAAYAFALKTVYYKNLAAYEIKTIHDKEPPPVEVLENVTARGGDLLSRTAQNYQISSTRDDFVNGQDEDGSGDEDVKTPKEDRMDIDEPGSGSGRTTRGLRQAPPQRVLFQPDMSSTRQIRNSSGRTQSPQPTATTSNAYSFSTSSNPSLMSNSVANYEPRPPMPLTLRGVTTPANNSALFYQQKQRLIGGKASRAKDVPKPGHACEGPNIYLRCMQALRSGIKEEQDYALHHLVKISHERGDKLKFSHFPNMAELLVEYALGVSSLYYAVKWDISYTEENGGIGSLDGLFGTPDILDRIKQLTRTDPADELETSDFANRLQKINEAGLTLRNLVLLEENAVYVSEMAQLRDFLSVALALPNDPRLAELKHYVLDITEQVTKYWSLSADDPLYCCLLGELTKGTDRGAILTTLRAICRISMNLEQPNALSGVPTSVIENLFNWLLLTDEELLGADLDFLYQYTAVPANVAFLLHHSHSSPATLSIHPFVSQLVRLCQHNHERSVFKILKRSAVPADQSNSIPAVPPDLMSRLLKMDEPDRSNRWMKCVFEEDAESEITQIALWQAYQSRFTAHSSEGAMLSASDFIKNVSSIFSGASAQVSNDNHQAKFIIKGIRARRHPVNLNGRPYMRCLWRDPSNYTLDSRGKKQPRDCSAYLLKSDDMFEHLCLAHIGLTRQPAPPVAEGENESTSAIARKWDLSHANEKIQDLDCYWSNCRRFSRQRTNPLSPTKRNLGNHVKTHLANSSSSQLHPTKGTENGTTKATTPQKEGSEGKEAVWEEFCMWNTATDEKGDAAGVPLTAMLVLRNLARNVPKAVEQMRSERSGFDGANGFNGMNGVGRNGYAVNGSGQDFTTIEVMQSLFLPLRDRLVWSLAHNRSLGPYVHDVLKLVDKGMEG
ncbi:MAG: hypothetical protein Q9214_000312 [Letrouitia sp. 1 TL-2023]